MAIDGRINVDVLFHDTDGTTSLKVVSLEDSQSYTTGKVAIVTGTAGTASVTLGLVGTVPTTTYKDSAGEFVSFAVVRRLAFAWSGSNQRLLTDAQYDSFKIGSLNGQASVTSFTPADNINPTISSGTGTGSYAIVIYGT